MSAAPSPHLPSAVSAERSHLQVPSQPDWIAPTVEYLKQKAILCGACQESRVGKVMLALHEALTNAIKHSGAAAISVRVASNRYVVHARIADDGAGGAVADSGSGLSGLNDRVEALGGRFVLESPPGRGTAISIELPMTTPGAP